MLNRSIIFSKITLGTLLSAALVLSACSEEEATALSSEPVVHGDEPGAPETFELSNGMQVVVIPDRRAPVVTHMVWYRVGAADEPEGMSGVAHFLEHLMFKGTDTIPPGELSKIVARNGGQDNAFTSSDFTAYFQRVAIDRLPLVMEMEADRMSNLVLTDAEVMPERDVVLEERSMRVDNNPRSLLSEKINQALFPVHPYGTPVIGWEREIAALSTENAIAFYDRFYTPNNAILIVAGDITAAELRPLAEKYYGSIERRADTPPRVRKTSIGPEEPLRVEHVDQRVRQATVQRQYRVPSYRNAPGLDSEAMDVLATLLGGSSPVVCTGTWLLAAVSQQMPGVGTPGPRSTMRPLAFMPSPRPDTQLRMSQRRWTQKLRPLSKRV